MDLETVAAALAPRLLAYACARTGDWALAEDIAQDSLLALVRCWRSGGRPDSPEAFAFAIAKRRAGRATAKRALLAPIDALLGRRSVEATADILVEQRERLADVIDAMKRLPRLDREVLLLRAVGELSTADIARIVGASPEAVKMRLHRARQRLVIGTSGVAYEHAPVSD